MNPDSNYTSIELSHLSDATLDAQLSDTATAIHGVASIPMVAHILTHPSPSWSEYALHTGAALMDTVDGRLKNRAVRNAGRIIFKKALGLRGPSERPTPQQWQELNKFKIVDRPRFDDIVDKEYMYTVTGALLLRALKNNNRTTAGLLAANLAVCAPRDMLKEVERHEATKHHLSVHAQELGKKKTKWHNIGMGILTNPVSRYAPGRAVGVVAISYGTALGVVDLHRYRRDVRHGKARAGELSGLL